MEFIKLFYGLLFVASLAYVQAELDIDELEMELENSDWTEESIDMDNSDEETGRNDIENPNCSCMDHSTCGCCVKPRVFGMKFPACLNATLLATETKNVEIIELAGSLYDKKVAQFNFTIEPFTKMCQRLSVPKFLSICLYNNNTSTDENGFVSCSSMDLMVRNTAAASLKFSCFQFKDNKVSFFNNKNAARSYISSWVSLKVKSPLQRVVEHIKKNDLKA